MPHDVRQHDLFARQTALLATELHCAKAVNEFVILHRMKRDIIAFR
jgi:hypothetical protein